MNRCKRLILSLLIVTCTVGQAERTCLQSAVDEMNDLYRTGAGCDDGVYNAISNSMVGWGIGLFIGIALLTGLVQSSRGSSSSSTIPVTDVN